MKRLRECPQCAGVAKSGKRCSINADCKLRTDTGNLACEPLRRGGRYCLFHAQIFNSQPAVFQDAMLFYLDFETTGLNVLSDSIVEIGLLDHRGSAVYSTVVQPPVFPGDEPTVHGIESKELSEGPTFPIAFQRMLEFLAVNVDMAVVDASDSSGDERGPMPALRERPPAVMTAGHNIYNFDLPILFVECLRHGIGEQFLNSFPNPCRHERTSRNDGYKA